MASDLRPIERFVMESLCMKYGGNFRIGEDPPDAYLSLNGKDIAVEISILTQHVVNESGEPLPRLSQDAGALSLCDEIDQEIKREIPFGIYVILTIQSPINKKRQTKVAVIRKIKEIVQQKEMLTDDLKIYGNNIKINLELGERLSGKKVIGMVYNQNSNPVIMQNILFILSERINSKINKCKNVVCKPLWLALFNDYCLAELDDYQDAMDKLPIMHIFDKICLVMESKELHVLYE